MGLYQADPDDNTKSSPKSFRKVDPPKDNPGSGYRFVDATEVTTYDECRSVYVGTTGNIELSGSFGTTATFVNVQDGTVLPTRATWWSGSASDVVFIY